MFYVDGLPWTKVAHGQKIRIKGKCPESSSGNVLVGCVFVEFEANLPEVDEYDDPAIERLEELRMKLAKEPLAKTLQKCP